MAEYCPRPFLGEFMELNSVRYKKNFVQSLANILNSHLEICDTPLSKPVISRVQKHLADYLKSLDINETEHSKYLEWQWKGIRNITGTTIGAY